MKVNHNITAVRTNLNLNRTNTKLDGSTYRLSSGMKINAAKDDPAGYAILKRMNRQIKGLDQADSNAGDAVSAINTAEGGLQEIHSILQRMNELAVQAANDVNTPEDRDNIQAEIKQLKDEINRIADTTDYTLLNGDSQRTSYVANSDKELADSISILSQSTTVMPGTYEFAVTSDPEHAKATFALAVGTYTINGEKVDITAEDMANNQAFEKVQKVAERCNISVEQNGASVDLTTLAYGEQAYIKIMQGNAVLADEKGKDVALTYNVTDGGFTDTTVMSIDGNIIKFTDANGFEMKIETVEGASAVGDVTADIKDASTMQVQIGSEADQMLEVVFEKVSTKTLGIDLTNLATAEGASQAITDVQNAIDKISTIRSRLGAYTNRLGYAQDNLSVQTYNVTDATSRMGDTDMSKEMTNYTQLNVLEQATSSILSKANQRAETILQLLQS